MEIRIEGPIGDPWGDGVSVREIVDQIKKHPAGQDMNVIINSPGGSAFDGVALFNEFMAHPSAKVFIIRSLAASAASIVAMAGSRVIMEPGALMMIHNAWAMTIGDRNEHAQMSEALGKMDVSLTDIYSARTGQDRANIIGWMDAETWMTADEAEALGFAGDRKAEQKVQAAFDPKWMSRADGPKVPFRPPWKKAPAAAWALVKRGTTTLPDGGSKNSGATGISLGALKDTIEKEVLRYA